MDKKLDVFLSSSVAEFKSERKHLSKKISEISLLECKLLEDRGPQAQSVELTSLSEVSKCDILVGILGHCDSEITRAEIKEAYKKRKYCLIYLQSGTKSEEMDRFIQEFITGKLVYDEFKRKRELYSKITGQLEEHIYKILTYGLEYFRNKQQESITKDEKAEVEAKRKIKEKDYKTKDVLREAKRSLGNGDYLSSVIMCGMSLELALKDWLIKTDRLPSQTVTNRSIGRLVRMIQDKEVMDRRYIHNMIEISMMRNRAVHEARMPSEQDAKTAINWAEELLEKLRI